MTLRRCLFALAVIVGACTARNPLFCTHNRDCASGLCDETTNTCLDSAGAGGGGGAASDAPLPVDAAPDAAPIIDAARPDAAPDAPARVCSSTCQGCNGRACCGDLCCGAGEWCDSSGPFPICRCGGGNACAFNTMCCASPGQCGSQCRSFCF